MNEPQQPSALITWCTRLALLCLVLVPAFVGAVHFGLVHYSIGLLGFALSCLGSLVLLLVLAIVSFLPRYRSERRRALLSSLYALPPVLLLGSLLGAGGDYPPIHDISTDTDDPPVFMEAVIQRGEDSNTLEIKPDVIAVQLEHYPQLATLHSDLRPEAAFLRATEVAREMNWEIYNSDPFLGIIEASYTSFWFQFVDDIIIRVSPSDGGSDIDLRSISRVGQGDLGANAKRITAFQARFQN